MDVCRFCVSVLFYEPKLLKAIIFDEAWQLIDVSVLFYEPKLLKRVVRSFAPVTLGFQCSSTSRNC